mmetsp:Transcript_53941/g.152855  ORF Transcript_53941/g.152855 Transcript_53941/m.152855 type:complete len:200 (+) Transcript_53941:273-872(+)
MVLRPRRPEPDRPLREEGPARLDQVVRHGVRHRLPALGHRRLHDLRLPLRAPGVRQRLHHGRGHHDELDLPCQLPKQPSWPRWQGGVGRCAQLPTVLLGDRRLLRRMVALLSVEPHLPGRAHGGPVGGTLQERRAPGQLHRQPRCDALSQSLQQGQQPHYKCVDLGHDGQGHPHHLLWHRVQFLRSQDLAVADRLRHQV